MLDHNMSKQCNFYFVNVITNKIKVGAYVLKDLYLLFNVINPFDNPDIVIKNTIS